MLGLRQLCTIDSRLREAFPANADKPFGGITILMAGDLRQLPPVLDKPLYSKDRLDQQCSRGRLLYLLFDSFSFQLTELMRQRGAENQQFRDELERLANGDFSEQDWDSWKCQDFYKMSDEQKRHFESTAITLAGLKKNLVPYNTSRLQALGSPIFKIEARNSPPSGGSFEPDAADGLAQNIYLARGAPVMLTRNLWTDAKVIFEILFASFEIYIYSW